MHLPRLENYVRKPRRWTQQRFSDQKTTKKPTGCKIVQINLECISILLLRLVIYIYYSQNRLYIYWHTVTGEVTVQINNILLTRLLITIYILNRYSAIEIIAKFYEFIYRLPLHCITCHWLLNFIYGYIGTYIYTILQYILFIW